MSARAFAKETSTIKRAVARQKRFQCRRSVGPGFCPLLSDEFCNVFPRVLAIEASEFGFLNFAGGVSGDIPKDDFSQSFVTGKGFTKLHNLFFGQLRPWLYGKYAGRDLAEAFIGNANHGNVLDFFMLHVKMFDLHGKDVFAAADDDIFFSVHQPDETRMVIAGNVARMEPAVDNGFGRGFRVFVVLFHDARSPDDELAAFAPPEACCPHHPQ